MLIINIGINMYQCTVTILLLWIISITIIHID